MTAKASKALARRASVTTPLGPVRALLTDLRDLILQARADVARAVDSGLVALY